MDECLKLFLLFLNLLIVLLFFIFVGEKISYILLIDDVEDNLKDERRYSDDFFVSSFVLSVESGLEDERSECLRNDELYVFEKEF